MDESTSGKPQIQSMELQYIELAFNKPVSPQEFSENPNIVKAASAGNKLRIYTANPSAVIEFL